MAVNLWSPRGDCHIGLTSGHTVIVPGDKAGAEVPQMFRREAIARGCIPVGTEPEITERDTCDRVTTIRRAAKRALANASARDNPTHQAVPPRDSAIDSEAAARPETPDGRALFEATEKATVEDHTVGTTLRDRAADAIMCGLRQAGDAGLTRSNIRDLFGRNLGADWISLALELLRREGKATRWTMRTSVTGRPREVWKVAK